MADLDLAIRVRADLKSALANLDKLERGTDDVGRSMRRASSGADTFTRAVGRLVTGDLIARGITAIARSTSRFAGDVVRAGVRAQSLTLAMRAVTADARAAADALAFVDDEAARLGIDLIAAEQGFISLTAAARGTALQGQATRDIFTGVAEAGRALNLGAASQAGALTAIEQIISKGTVSAEELRGQLGERLPGAFQIAARAMGVTTEELDNMLRRGEVAARDGSSPLARGTRHSPEGPRQDS